jgi:hypothetical protein
MRTARKAIVVILWGIASAIVNASPPSQVGDTFLIITAGIDYINTGVYYLAQDGTYLQLSYGGWGPGPVHPTYSPSAKGTYTYQLSPGSSNQATLTMTPSGDSQIVQVYPQILIFTSDTGGDYEYSHFGTFTFYLPVKDAQLENVSNRVTLHANDMPIAGFVIGGTSSRLTLIRSVGPSLATFGVSPCSKSPQFSLFAGTGNDVYASGQSWSVADSDPFGPYAYDAQAMGWIFGIAGAFPLISGSAEQVFFGVLPSGSYTVQTTDPTATSAGGAALVEVYILPYSS